MKIAGQVHFCQKITSGTITVLCDSLKDSVMRFVCMMDSLSSAVNLFETVKMGKGSFHILS